MEKMTGSSDSLANGHEVDPLRSSGKGWKRELGNGVEYDRVLTGAVKFPFKLVRAGCFLSFRIGSCVRFDPRTMAN
jgi:hypothetical protein